VEVLLARQYVSSCEFGRCWPTRSAAADAPCLRVPDPGYLHAIVGRQGDEEVMRSYRFSSVLWARNVAGGFLRDASGVRGLIDEALEG